jgi:hypothetical protein
VKLTTHPKLFSMFRKLECIYPLPLRLHSLVLKYLSTGTTLPSSFLVYHIYLPSLSGAPKVPTCLNIPTTSLAQDVLSLSRVQLWSTPSSFQSNRRRNRQGSEVDHRVSTRIEAQNAWSFLTTQIHIAVVKQMYTL